jgi:nicotinamidase-related amidase
MDAFRSTIIDLQQLEARRTAVIAIHWQNDVVEPSGAFGAIFAKAISDSGVIGRTSQMLIAARKAGCLIIFVRVVYQPEYRGNVENNALFRRARESKGFIVGTRGVDIIDALRRYPAIWWLIIVEAARSTALTYSRTS